MMTKEYNIGDWVYSSFSDKPCRIVGIKLLEGDYADVKVEGVEGWKDINSLTPIPLTPEILEKNGLHLYNRKTNNLMEDCNHSDCFEEDEEFRMELSLDYNGKIRWSINGDEYSIMPLDYVHQLQHALRLCNINKQIIL